MDDEYPEKFIEKDDEEEIFQLNHADIADNTEANELEDVSAIFEDEGLDIKDLKLDAIEGKLNNLYHEFQSKIKYDTHKEKIIDDLHNELREYKDGLIKKQVIAIIKDIIVIIDNVRKSINYDTSFETSSFETTSIDSEKFFKHAEGVISDLEDILMLHDVEPFIVDNSVFDPARQRVVQKVETSEKIKDKTIARRLCPGYESEKKIIRPEKVEVYVFNDML